MDGCTPFYIVVLSQLVYLLVQSRTAYYTAREGIAAAALVAVVNLVLLWLLRRLGQSTSMKTACPLLGKGLAILLAGWGVIQLVRLSDLCRQEYRAGGFWVLLVVIGLLCLPIDWNALCRLTQTLGLFGILTGAILLGLLGHMSWKNLSYFSLDGTRVWQAFSVLWYTCPELLALPWLKKQPRSLWWKLPVMAAVLESICLLVAEAVFGWQADTGRFPAMETVRCCGVGAFSRLDDVLIGFWLLLCLYRLVVLGQLVRNLYRGGETNAANEE